MEQKLLDVIAAYMLDHERMPRDAYPKIPRDPLAGWMCRCEVCEMARAVLLEDDTVDDTV